jgi:hypothetical protein
VADQPQRRRKHNPAFFERQPDGSVRLRLRFENEEAALFEEAAGDTPVMTWLHRTLVNAAKEQVLEQRRNRPSAPPPE